MSGGDCHERRVVMGTGQEKPHEAIPISPATGAEPLAPEYVAARRVLLDALEALAPHSAGLILVGAQAIYLHTGAGQLAIVEYTTDADLVVAPDLIADSPLVEALLTGAGFFRDVDPGRWISPGGVYVDLLVPESLAGPGRRGADLGPHGRHAARRARGLEAALVENAPMTITALDPADVRSTIIRVAGQASLVVAKTIKIAERLTEPGRERDKDALDVVRLLRGTPTSTLADGVAMLSADDRSALITAEALEEFERLFAQPDSPGTLMAVEAARPLEDADVLAASTSVLAIDLLDHTT